MKKERLFTLLATGSLIFGAMQTFAGLERSARPEFPKAGEKQKSVPVPKGMERKLRGAVTSVTSDFGLRNLDSQASARRRTNSGNADKISLRASSKASSIEGLCIYREGAADLGWYKVSWPTDALKWKRPASYSPMCGFVRGAELFAFYSLSDGEGIVDAGIAVQNAATGEVNQYYQTDIFDSLEQVAIAAAYNEKEDLAYVATYNKGGTAYILQKFDPKTVTFTSLGATVPATMLDMAWNPTDESVYILDESGDLQRYDTKTKKFNTVLTYSYDMTDYPNDMVWSAKDNAFFALLDSYDDYDYACTDAVLLGMDGKVTYLGTIADNPQYSILHIPDAYVNPDGPKAPVFKSWDVEGAALSGSLKITLPSAFENGKTISGTVYIKMEGDGETLTGTPKGTAGSEISLPVRVAEGLHRFTITPYVLTDDGKAYGTALVVNRYFGVDTPASPSNVKLTESQVTWNAVTKGANDGWIDASAVRYEVKVDGVSMTEAPVSGTSVAISLPATGAVAHRATVTAIAGGKTSEPGISGKYYSEGALSLPVELRPDEGATDMDAEMIGMFTSVKNPLNTEDLRGWRYDDQSEKTGGFYCLAPKTSPNGEKGDEWLFLPAINFPDALAHYRFSMEVWSGNHYFTSDEFYEVAIAKRPTGTKTTLIREEDIVYKGRYFELSETLFQVPEAGDWYIGIHYVSPLDAYRLYARNFKVEKAEASADSPAAVTQLTGEGAARGELKAILSFNMPSVTISGNALDAAENVTAIATTEAGTASVTAKPGQKATLEVPTKQGDNIVQVATSSSKGQGLSAEVVVYTGVYRPGSAFVDCKVSDDNQTLTLDIDLDDYNELDQYAGADESEMTIYRKVGSEWRIAAEIGKSRTWTFQCPEPAIQEMYAFGVAAHNAAGYAEEMTTFGVHLGKLVQLPMKETFPWKGENVNITYEPLTIDHISYLPADWGFCDPADVDDAAANESGIALYATWEAESQVLLPRFSTKGMNNVKLDLGLFFGNKSPEMITVFATSPSVEMEPVAYFTRTDGSGWEHKLVSLPASCQNHGWVQIIIRTKMQGYSQYFLLESYSIADYPETMLTVSGMKGNKRGVVGEPLSYTVEIENAGTKATPMAAHTFTLLTDNEAVELTAENVPSIIASGEKETLVFSHVPTSAHIGDAVARFSLAGQPSSSVSETECQTRILNAPVPVVTDLEGKAELTDDVEKTGNVNLTWTKPGHMESFEAFEPWDYSREMRGFINEDFDGGEVLGIAELNYPGKYFAKGYQVFSGEATDNPLLKAHTGEHYLACLSAKKGASDDWFISPEVKGGSTVSFWLNLLSEDYPETILVMSSNGTNNTGDFIQLAGGYICPAESGWKKYAFTLPADARYLAIHHVGDNGDEQFGFFLDDLAFTPADGGLAVEGYNIYRNHELIATDVQNCDFTDRGVDLSSPVMYVVKAVATVNGAKIESDRSNVIWVEDPSEVKAIEAANSENMQWYNLQGLRISRPDNTTPCIGIGKNGKAHKRVK